MNDEFYFGSNNINERVYHSKTKTIFTLRIVDDTWRGELTPIITSITQLNITFTENVRAPSTELRF